MVHVFLFNDLISEKKFEALLNSEQPIASEFVKTEGLKVEIEYS